MEPGGIKRYLGIDVVDLAIHVGITVCALVFIDQMHGPLQLIPVTVGASMVIFGIRRRAALRKRTEAGVTSGEMTAVRLEEIEQRVADLEAREAHVAELENRIDFAERMLANPEESRKWTDGTRVQ